MFNRKRKKKSTTTCETEVNGRNIHYYAENSGATPVAFYTPDVVASFDIEETSEEFLQKTDLDQFNGEYMSAIIEAKIQEGYKDLDRQHRAHIATIQHLEGNIRSDLIVIRERISFLEAMEKDLSQKLQKLGEETI